MKYLLLALFLSTLASAQDQLGTVSATMSACPKTGLVATSCYKLIVSCPDVADSQIDLKVFHAENPIATDLLGVGGTGNGFWEDYTYGSTTIQELLVAHHSVVELSFADGWEENANSAGVRKAACRYATTAVWTKAHLSPSLHLNAAGVSAGSALIGYGLAHYGIDRFLNFALLVSGPPFVDLPSCCDGALRPPGLSRCSGKINSFAVGVTNAQEFIDPAYQPKLSAACSSSQINRSDKYGALFAPDSIVTSRAQLKYAIPVHFLWGHLDDEGSAMTQGQLYEGAITSSVSDSCVADAGHLVPDVQDGAEAVARELIAHSLVP